MYVLQRKKYIVCLSVAFFHPKNRSIVHRSVNPRVPVMFHLKFVHYTFSSIWVAEWQPFGK